MNGHAPHPLQSDLNALAAGTHSFPFDLLGPQREGGRRMVRTLQPDADSVSLLDRQGEVVLNMRRVHDGGIFEAELPPRLRSYRLRLHDRAGHAEDIEDPYRFSTTFGDVDLHLLGEGTHQRIYTRLGAHVVTHKGVRGTCFAVWAPNASRVSVIGDFNRWDGRRHVMRVHRGNGVWELFVPGVLEGARYKFELLDGRGRLLPFKADPVGQFHQGPPGNASIVYRSGYRWRDDDWMRQRAAWQGLDRPISIYEVHLGSWRRHEDGGWLSYRELAERLVAYVKDMNFTHVEFLPITEHPFDGSWGYQPIGMFAPTQRFGEPDDFRYLVDRLHGAGIGVIVDWVPAHFPGDDHGLARFDGTHLYEHEDPRKGRHGDWGTLVFNYGGREVINYLIGSALYWLREFHVDGLRVDAVASMLYLDYSRKDGEWVPNRHGGRENLEAIDFLRRLNTVVHAEGGTTYAEESTTWPGVSRPVDAGGLASLSSGTWAG